MAAISSAFLASRPEQGDSAAGDAAIRETPQIIEDRKLRLATFGLSGDQQALLRAILGVLSGRTRSSWSFSSVAQADVVIVDGAALDSLATKRASAGRLAIVVCTPTSPSPVNDISLPSPISVMNVLEALDLADERLSQKTATIARRNTDPMMPSATSDRSSLASTIARLVSEPHYRRIRARISDFGTLSIGFNERTYEVDFPRVQLAKALRERRYVLTAVPTDDDHPNTVVGPLNELLWTVGLSPCVDFQIDETAPLRLQQWPNFPRLPHTLEHLQLCGLLGGRVITMQELVRESERPADRVKTFLTACFLCGYVQLNAEAPQMHELLAPSRSISRGGFLDRLLKRLGF